ncbi:hypothetical protein GOP47_0008860 [Adiantum capillus-veneris]|uniref:Radial spoke head protein 9 homolog n=1 Tax=Adiantum capillus-veneris TaxID=13818 RepID=A0A9D4ZL44_ADICA|nr:hypothetical protein GOP47_0008860 [Adiantum capillus-veneris]
MEGNVTLAMEALAASGVLVPSEQRAALGRSLLVKQQEARLSALAFWGRILTSTGHDYLLARGCNSISPSSLHFDTHYYYRQDGVKWMDLQALTDDTYEACKSIRGCFTGEPSHIYSVKLAAPSQNEQDVNAVGEEMAGAKSQQERQMDATKEEAGQEDVEIRQDDEQDAEETKDDDHSEMGASKLGPGFRTLEIGELDRVSALMRQVDYDCGVVPKGAYIYNSKKELVKNVHFPGVKFLQNLDSFVHLFQKYEDTPLSDDVRGSWSFEHIPFEGVVLRSLWWPGYVFYYTTQTKDFGSLYFGMGEKNVDLPFMI